MTPERTAERAHHVLNRFERNATHQQQLLTHATLCTSLWRMIFSVSRHPLFGSCAPRQFRRLATDFRYATTRRPPERPLYGRCIQSSLSAFPREHSTPRISDI